MAAWGGKEKELCASLEIPRATDLWQRIEAATALSLSLSRSISLPHREGVTFRIQLRKPNLIEPGENQERGSAQMFRPKLREVRNVFATFHGMNMSSVRHERGEREGERERERDWLQPGAGLHTV